MSRCAVNVAFCSGHHGFRGDDYYPAAQRRLVRSLRRAGSYDGELVTWTDELPPGAEPHAQVHYHFKHAAMQEASNRGHRALLWLDAVMVVIRPLSELWRRIEERGYFLWSHTAGWTVGDWTSDECLAHYGMLRGEARTVPMLCSGVFGYSLDHPLGRRLHEEFVTAPASTIRGAWHNRNSVVSRDRRVQGHRHDQSVLSILAHRLGLELSLTPEVVAPAGQEDERTVIVHDFEGRLGWES